MPQRPPTRDELDDYIRTRLSLIGIDLSVLPEDDPSAPADQLRVLRSARNVLTGTVPALSDYSLDPQEVPPSMYPAHLPTVRQVAFQGGEAGGEAASSTGSAPAAGGSDDPSRKDVLRGEGPSR